MTARAGSSCLRENDSPRMSKMMPAICGIALSLLLFSSTIFGQTSSPSPTPTPAKTVVFLGDSLTAGFGVDPSEAYPALIADKIRAAHLPFEVINAGLSGDTSAGGLRRIDWLLQRPIDVLVIALGGNDGLRGLAPKALKENLQAIIDKAKAKNPQVKIVIAGMQIPPNLGADYAAEFQRVYPEIARENRAALIPFLLEGIGGHRDLNQPDLIHPTSAGHKVIADLVWRNSGTDPSSTMSVIDGCSALITGASAGIGREFALQLASRAKLIVLVARRRDRLEELCSQLTHRNPQLKILIRESDLSDIDSPGWLFESLQAENVLVDLLINNAGLGDHGHFATSDRQRVREMLAVNVTALTILTRLFLPGMIDRKRGAILNVSSTAGFVPLGGFAVYAATKAYVTSFSEGIRSELRGTGVTVTALCPGPVDTEFSEVARRSPTSRQKKAPTFLHVPVEKVVRSALDAVENDKPLIIPGFFMKLAMLLARITPAPLFRAVSRASAKR